MRRALLGLLGGALWLAGCGRKAERASAGGDASLPPAGAAEVVVVPANSPKLRQIRVAMAEAAEVPAQEVVAPGKVEVNPSLVSRVLLPAAGRIAEVLVRLGDAVRQGQPLLTIESPDAEAAQAAFLQAEASLIQAKAVQVKAQADFDRASDLYEHNAIAKKEVLNSESALAQARSAVEQAQAMREQAARRLSLLGLDPGRFGQKIVVRAPLAGKVLDLAVAAGEYRNDTNAPLMTIADLSSVWIASDVPETDIRWIHVGEPVEIELVAYPGERFHGRVTRIGDTVDPQTRTVKVRAEMENRGGRLRPDMFGRIRHTGSVQRVPVVPETAVIQGDGKAFLYVERAAGRFQQREVRTGRRSGNRVSVLEGLRPGERVVVDGAILLRGGT